jgi:serine phosphatase RsbU (regulator of sigma subunit)
MRRTPYCAGFLTLALALCLVRDFAYADTPLTLQPGERLILYTDGVTEAANGERALFQEEGLARCLGRVGSESPSEVVRDVLRAVEEFSEGAPPADDVTLVVLRYKGPDADGIASPARS